MTMISKSKEYVKEYNKKYKRENKDLLNEYHRNYRHKNGISKKYISKYGGKIIGENKESIRMHRKKYKALSRKAGLLNKDIIQKVYEENIKKYGTLTCIYCYKKIIFGDDSLEHILPLSRGGTHDSENLGIACLSCNKKKHNKTIEEFMKKGGI